MNRELIVNARIVDPEADLVRDGALLIDGDTILEIGPPGLAAPDGAARIDATDRLVMPGLVNAHSHLFQTFVRGLADDKPLLQWLETAIWPVMQAVTEEEMYLASLLGLVENIRSGATCVGASRRSAAVGARHPDVHVAIPNPE